LPAVAPVRKLNFQTKSSFRGYGDQETADKNRDWPTGNLVSAGLLSQYRFHHPKGGDKPDRNHQTCQHPKCIGSQTPDRNLLNLVKGHPLKVIRVSFGNELYARNVDSLVAHRKKEWLRL